MIKNFINCSTSKLPWSLRLLLIFSFLLVPQLAFPHSASAAATPASDNFNRADGALGANWTAISDGAMAISSQAVIGTAGATTGDIWTATTFASDQYSQIQVTSTPLSGGQWVAAAVRVQGSGQNAYAGLYYWNFGSPELMLFKRSGGAWAQLGSTYSSGVLPAGTQLEVSAVGSTISFLQNGVQRISVTDSSFTGGAPGIIAYGNSTADNWAGANATSGTTYSVGGTVSGLSGTVVLQDNGGDNLSVTASGPFTFATALASGAAYSVTVKTNPSGQACTVSGGSGTVGSANVTSVTVSCAAAASFSVGGTVSGLSGTVVLQDNGGDDLSLSASGPFTFATKLASGAAYSVTVKTNPSGQACTVSAGSGTVASANVTSVAVSCAAAASFSVGGTVSGLSGTVVLQDNGGDNLSVSASGPFTFATKLASGAAYSVTVNTNPSGQTCTVSAGSGTVASANVTSVTVSCAANAAGTASDNFNRADGALGANWTAISDGAMAISSQAVIGTAGATTGDIWTATTFASDQYSQIQVTSTPLSGGQWVAAAVRVQGSGQNAYAGLYYWNFGSPELMLFKRSGGAWAQLGSTYSSGVLPAGTQLEVSAVGSTISFLQNGVQRISVTDSSFTGGAPGIIAYGNSTADNWAGANATSGTTYSVGGTVSGLSGTVVLQDNGGDNLSVTASGSFTFATALASGAAYSVTVKTNPSGQACTVSGGSGTVGSANVTSVTVSCAAAASFSVGGTVSGLSGTVVLQDNGGDDLSLSASGPFTFATKLASGAAYSVTVKTNPSGQACTVSAGSGTVASANVTSVAVSCAAAASFSVGGTVSGLSGTVVLQDNGGDNLSVSASGPFTFATKLASGAAYSVTVNTNPSGQTCTVSAGSGTVASANVTSVTVSCAANAAGTALDNFNRADGALGANWTAISDGAMAISSQAVIGTAGATTGDIWTATTFASDQYSQIQVTSTPLSGGQWVAAAVRVQGSGQNAYAGLYYWNFGSPELMLFKRSGGAWAQLGSTYSSGVLPAGTQLEVSAVGSTISFLQNGVQRISVTDSSFTGGAPGIIAYGNSTADNWAGANATSGTTYSVGGTVSGLSGTVVLQDNGGDNLSVTASGPFTFATALASGAAYSVTVKTNPSGQACTVSGGSGTVGSANVTNVAVSCANVATFTVGGSVSGLSGTVVLQDNGGDNLSVTANGSFTFATSLASGAAYSVTVGTNPSGQTCTVSSGSGTVGTANVTSVTVTCQSIGPLTVSYVSTDTNGVATYNMTSPIVSGGTTEPLRVLTPTNPAPGVAHNFLIALPVEPGEGTTYGDAMSTLESLNAQNQYNLTIVEPSFAIDPWYADSATDPNELMETFMTDQLVPWIKAHLATTGKEQVWLIGFSKSGVGAQDLILKHPNVYTLAASWDFPDSPSYDALGSSEATAYGTNANFLANYQLSQNFVNTYAAPFAQQKRLWIGGYYYFDWDVYNDYAPELTNAHVLYDAESATQMAHNWGSGWVPGALAALYHDSINLSS